MLRPVIIITDPKEAIIRAIETKHPKVILASLALFNHVKRWQLLLKLAKKYNRYGKKCKYHLNATDNLKLFPNNGNFPIV